MVSIIEFMDIENLNPARVILFAKAVNWDRSAPAIRLAADRYDTSFEQKKTIIAYLFRLALYQFVGFAEAATLISLRIQCGCTKKSN